MQNLYFVKNVKFFKSLFYNFFSSFSINYSAFDCMKLQKHYIDLSLFQYIKHFNQFQWFGLIYFFNILAVLKEFYKDKKILKKI